jgi:hypothetical protein
MFGKLKRNVEHGEAVKGHPPSTVSLFKDTSRGQWLGTVEQTDIIESQETTLKDVLAIGIFAIDPPGEVEQKLLENSLKEIEILASVQLSFNLEGSESSPGMDGRIDITKVPFVSIGSVSPTNIIQRRRQKGSLTQAVGHWDDSTTP